MTGGAISTVTYYIYHGTVELIFEAFHYGMGHYAAVYVLKGGVLGGFIIVTKKAKEKFRSKKTD
jgi:hypothetical protein